MNHYHEIVFTIQFLKDVTFDEVQSGIAELINRSMLLDEELKNFHHQRGYKLYCFSAPYPLEQDKIYREGRMYCFNLRTMHLNFALKIKQYLSKTHGIAKVISSDLKNYSFKHINELITLTPIVCTLNNRCWLHNDGIALLSERLHLNAYKKCKSLDDSFEETAEFFFDRIEILNKVAIKIKYKGKNTILLGHKIKLSVKPQPWAQQMANIVLASGALEKNSLGLGYCLARR
ncbi:CRISPR-associated protein Cas6 [Dehalobacterium formicoaceticum]|uniref:CRISPR-associated protein Cas6 n=1 Tax=Dehalobacterium formicoaceticum TaxID=51515 RepID=UPI000B7F4A9F|nr:CRISPR-associated protein Cas6 [Dehalobacterium formicoaceticum]